MFKGTLYDYQQDGVEYMLKTKKCFNTDDCGLGKTIQALAYIDRIVEEGSRVMLVVKPAHILQWEDEIRKFTDLSFIRPDGSKNKRIRQYQDFKDGKASVLLINYNKVIFDWQYLHGIREYIDSAVFDEAFALKNPESSFKNRFETITKGLERIVMLTATPMSSTLYDFYNIMRVAQIPALPSDEDFIEQYVEVEDTFVKMAYKKYAKHPNFVGSRNIEQFKEEYGKYFIHRDNNAHYNFALNIIRHPLEMSAEQKKLCYELQQAFINQGPDSTPIPAVKVYSQFSQIADSPKLLREEMEASSPKIEELMEILRATSEQIIVYAKYLKFHELIQEDLQRANITFEFLSGKDKPEVKDRKKKNFISGNVRVLLITEAGKEGLNLQTSHNLVLMDVPATSSDAFQFIGRIYRTGQEYDVNVHFLYMLNSLEEDQMSNVVARQQDIDVLLDQNKAETFKGFPRIDRMASFIKRNYR